MDLVMLGGQLLTMDPQRPRAQAMAARDGRIAAVGTSAEIAALIQDGTSVVHLAGRCVIPGFVDPHTHFSLTCFEPIAVDCSIPPLAGKQAVLDALAAAAADAPPGRWILGMGYSTRRGSSPSELKRTDLDAVAPENPVCVVDSSVHAVYVNSAAMKLAAITLDSTDPDGGRIVRDDDGEPAGPLWERATDRIHQLSMRALTELYGAQGTAELVRQNATRFARHGITSAGDAAVTPEAARLFELALQHDALPLMLHQLRAGEGFFAVPELVARGEIAVDDIADRLRGGTMKMFMDPVFPQYAGIRVHADGRHEPLGHTYYTQEAANDLATRGDRLGLQVAIHCLGTWAIEQGLETMEVVARESARADARHRIEHFSQPTRAQIGRAAAMGVTVVHQPSFFFSFGDRAAATLREHGIDAPTMPMRTMLDEGVEVAASSDFPCAALAPLLGIHSLVSRQTRHGGEPIAPEEAISAEEAIRLYTIAGARAMHRDHEVGSIEVGKRADLVVLSHDPSAVDPAFIREITVEQTYIDGQRLLDTYAR